MNYKNIVVSWLFETELSNMNAGEGPAFYHSVGIGGVTKLFIEADSHIAAVQHGFSAAQFPGPFFRFGDDETAEAVFPVFRKYDNAAKHHGGKLCLIFRQFVQTACRDGKIPVQQYDIFGIRRIMFIKFFPKCDMVLLCHCLNADIIGSGLLPYFRCSHYFYIHNMIS